MILELGFIKDEICNRNGCQGVIQEYSTDTSCSCHISPPCSHCTDDRNYCEDCGWQGRDEQLKPMSNSEIAHYQKAHKEWEERRKLFWQKYRGKIVAEKLEMIVEGHTHFTQKVVGVFPKGSETKDTLLPKVKGTFGGRFTMLDDFRFEYIAYTD